MNPPATTASAAALPFKQVDDEAMPSGAQWGVTLMLCIALLAVLVLVLKRRGGNPPWRKEAGMVEVLERKALTAQTQLVVARYDGRRLLLSVGPAGTQCLRDDAEGERA
ncbi:hypothetical protein ACS5PN_28015 [Roseateles sp. NT4]|uniref:hypothetical protein n=1 Tax=Roseateles sp. NT4 TaxID=3453715 RepID=UPI003EED24C0